MSEPLTRPPLWRVHVMKTKPGDVLQVGHATIQVGEHGELRIVLPVELACLKVTGKLKEELKLKDN